MSYSYEKRFDVVIVGAGAVGCAIAYYLARESGGKLKVGVIERNNVGAETSGGAAGMLAAQVESPAPGPLLDLSLASRKLFPQLAADLAAAAAGDMQLVQNGIADLAYRPEDQKALQERMNWQKAAGLECEGLDGDAALQRFPFLKEKPLAGFFAPSDGQVSALRLTETLAEGARKLGAEIFEYESFEEITLKKPRTDFMETNVSKFVADKFIFAAGPWTGQLLKDQVPVQPVKGQLINLEIPQAWRDRYRWETPLYCGKVPGPDPIACYFVPKKDGQLVIGASMENRGFDRSVNAAYTQKLLDYAARLCPDVAQFPVRSVWVGLRPGSPDELPVMGLVPGYENVYVASGHLRNGILLAPITGKLFAEMLLQGKTSIPLQPFSPERFAQTASTK